MATSEVCVKTPQSGRKRVRAGNERGNSLIEFGLVVPVLMLIVTGMVSSGFVLNNALELNNGVNTGAQLLAISRGMTTDPCATAYSAIRSAALTLNTGLSLTFVINGSTYTATNSCPAGAANMVQGKSVQVTATYPCTFVYYGFSRVMKNQD